MKVKKKLFSHAKSNAVIEEYTHNLFPLRCEYNVFKRDPHTCIATQLCVQSFIVYEKLLGWKKMSVKVAYVFVAAAASAAI